MTKDTKSPKAKTSSEKPKRKRRVVAFPTLPYEQPLELASALFKNGSGQPVRRLTLFDAMGKAPESGPSRTLISAASKYGLIKGSSASDYLELTETGRRSVDENSSPAEQATSRISSAIKSVPAFSSLYEKFKGNKLPAKPVLIDSITEFEIDEEQAEQAVDIFLENLQTVGLLQTLSGAERIISEEHLRDSVRQSDGNLDHIVQDKLEISFAPPITRLRTHKLDSQTG